MINVICGSEIDLDYVTPQQMAEAESRAAAHGLGVEGLMENAGAAIARKVRELYGGDVGRTVTVVCGTGNNGGDGFVAARYLSSVMKVRVLILASDASKIKTSEAKLNLERLHDSPVEISFAGDVASLLRRAGLLEEADLVVDAILGTGVRGEVREPIATAIRLINESNAATVAVDLPSGLDPASGSISSAGAVRADTTITLHRPKVGLRGKMEYTGEVVVVPIGISADW